MRGAVDTTTNYAYQWLPADFRNKNISSFGRSVFQNIITDTIGNNRTRIIEKSIVSTRLQELKKKI